ncbi:RAD50-interacting protein 1-like isoform X2 [Amphiura filiformis]|uniref:RAD50-interacting protein 1-like isoform X2 n=1 Tax=Amphiura filiformis TaxID=82378 RepID=UPI003B20DFE5
MLASALQEKRRLEQQLSAVSSATPSRIQSALREAELATGRIDSLAASHKKTRRDVQSHLNQVEPYVQQLDDLTKQVQELEKCMEYMKWLAMVEQLSSEVHSAISANAMPSAVQQFANLAQVSEALQDSACINLQDFVTSTVLFWYQILKDKLASEFDEVVKALGWPFVAAAISMPPTVATQKELRTRLATLFGQLLKLQLPEILAAEDKASYDSTLLPGTRQTVLPLQLLLQPLRKRFRYHFHGKKQTNSLDKPEWYFTQVLNWIRDHNDFLEGTIQPFLDTEEYAHINAKTEFTRGLLQVVAAKLTHDIPELLFDEQLLSHTIDELLLFDKELRSNYGYPKSQPGCLHVLTAPACFDKWIMIEKAFAVQKMDTILESSMAWCSQYKDMADADELKVPECVESFMTLILVITERYRCLPSPTHHLRFLELQLDLLDDFRVRLLQLIKLESGNPLAGRYAAILNGANYIIGVLQEWSEQVFFLQLQYFNKEQATMESFNSALESLGGSSHDISKISKGFDESQMDMLEGTVFDEILELYSHLRDDMTAKLEQTIINDIRGGSRPFQKEKWFSMPSPKDYISPALSSTVCILLQTIKERLQQIEEQLCQTVLKSLWQGLAGKLTKFVYEEVILVNQFNEGGALQLQYDMTRGLFPLFGQFTQRPENYFKDVKESCLLLNLKAGSAILLRDLLYQSIHEKPSKGIQQKEAPVSALHDIGVYRLSPRAAEIILNLRTDWPKY